MNLIKYNPYINYATSIWTPEKKDELMALHKDGLSFSDIAKKMNVSKNSIAGICHRLGLKNPHKAPKHIS